MGLSLVLAVLPPAYRSAGAQSPKKSLGGKIDAQKQKLKKLQEDINRHRAKSRELRREETGVVRQLSRLDKEMALSRKLLAGIVERETLLGQQIDSLRVSIAYESDMLEYQRGKLAARIRQMYKRGPYYRLEVILASPNIQEVLRRYKFLRMVAERDARLVEEVRSRKSELERERAALTEAMVDVVALKAERAEEDRRLSENRRKRVSMLRRIRTERSEHDRAIEELRRSQEKLKNLIDEMEKKRLADRGTRRVTLGDFAKLRGKLMRPVRGAITKKFGQDRHPKFGTVTFNNGVNIKAPAGTPIRSVAVGRVEFVDWIAGYGNCIILNHGGGYYTLYAHVAEIFVAPGQVVKRSEVIAEVGDTGSLNGYECHFEIRKSKQALDPMKWFAR